MHAVIGGIAGDGALSVSYGRSGRVWGIAALDAPPARGAEDGVSWNSQASVSMGVPVPSWRAVGALARGVGVAKLARSVSSKSRVVWWWRWCRQRRR